MRHGVVGVGETVVSGVFPLDEVLVGESVGRRHVVGERRAWARRDVNVHAEETAASVDVNVAGAIDGAVEGVVAEVAEVVGEEVVGGDVEVVAQTCEALVVEASADMSFVSLGVAQSHSVEFYLVGNEFYGLSVDVVSAVERRDHCLCLVDGDLSGEVYLVERTGESQSAVGMSCDVADEALGERV